MEYAILLLMLLITLSGCQTQMPRTDTSSSREDSSAEPGGATVSEPQRSISNASGSREEIMHLAVTSQCANHFWKDRGVAPPGYIKGMSLTFAKAVCNETRSDNQVVALANTGNIKTDALAWYKPEFDAANMDNSITGKDTLRHAYTLLIGLGMRESSGKYCEGRDMSANFSAADSAEAGLFQASWGSHPRSEEMKKLFEKYEASSNGCLFSVFKDGVSCSSSAARNWGNPEEDGFVWQKITKACPAFAAEYAAVLIRVHGGTKGEFGPLRRKEAEVLPQCEEMLRQVQTVIEQHPAICDSL